ncbi:MAG: AAA family ATPase [Salinarimonas sp.]
MRNAQANDYISKLTKARGKWIQKLFGISILNYRGIKDLKIEFTHNLNVFVGANGAGKTRVLEALECGLCNENTDDIKLNAAENTDSLCYHLIRTNYIVGKYQRYFATIRNAEEDLLNGAAERTLNQQELDEISYILCRKYDKITIYELSPGLAIDDSPDGDRSYSDEVVPFFTVESQGVFWDTSSMGAGEFAALYIWWAMNLAEEEDIFIIEEPEMYLSYKVQERLSIHIAKMSFEKKFFICISTHSYPFIARYPNDGIFGLLMSGPSVRIANRGKADILSQIGAPIEKRYIFVCEDKIASFVFENILLESLPETRLKAIIATAEGQEPRRKSGISGITCYLEASRHISNIPLLHIGVYDGDARDDQSLKTPKTKDLRKIFLPGDIPFDQVFVEICRDKLDEFSSVHPEFRNKFIEHDGADFHDHLRLVCEDIGRDEVQIWAKCLEIWGKSHQDQISDFCDEVTEILKR